MIKFRKFLDNRKNNPPIVVYHFGRQNYFKSMVALLNRVGFIPIVISEGSLLDKNSVKQLAIPKIDGNDSKWGHFMNVYEHMSTNRYQFELLCFKRWFDMHELMKISDYESFWHFDSDIVISPDFHAYKRQIEAYNATAFCTLEQNDNFTMSSSAHVSFWRVKDLELFLDFLILVYKEHKHILLEKWNHHSHNNLLGGVCDMTLLYLWSHSKVSPQSSGQILNLNKLHNETWNFNDNININIKGKPFGLLKIAYKNGSFFEVGNKSPMPFIHCQGGAKILINLLRIRVPIYFGLKITLGHSRLRRYLTRLKVFFTRLSIKEKR